MLTDLKEIKKIPLTDKEIIIKNLNKIINKDNKDFYISRTGGSSGKSLSLYLDNESIYKERAFVYNYWSNFGYDYKKSKLITFRGLEFKDKIFRNNPIYNEIVLSPFKLSEKTIDEYICIINKFKPEFISGYPSALLNFCKLLKRSKELLKRSKELLKIKFSCVFLISENCYEEDISVIESSLECKANSFYGHSERAVFAERYNDSYYFNKSYGFTEFIDTGESNKYKIVCTGFINRKMPLIRYLTDDIAIIKDDKVNIIGHRDKEVLVGKNGEKISITSINFHTNEFEKIKQYQFIQDKEGFAILNIIEDDKIYDNDIKGMLNVLNKKINNVLDIEIRIVNEIALTSRGKLKTIIQNINNL